MTTSLKAASIVVLILALWMLSGLFSNDDATVDTAQEASADELMRVGVTIARTMLMTREIDLHGQLNASRRVLLKAQTSGEVDRLLVNKGTRVAANDIIVLLNEGGRRNSLAEAQASVKSARSEQAAAQALRQQRLQSQLQLEQADAALEAALARLASIELDLGYTRISAPFDGILNDLLPEQGALIERGDVIAELIDDSAFKVSATVPQTAVTQLNLGQNVTIDLITGESMVGQLTYISAIADDQTRSFVVEAKVENPGSSIATGVSATMSVPVEEVEATFITPSALSLGQDGTLGVKALDNEQRVLFLPVSLVKTELDGAWVSGIPNNTPVITLGQGFVGIGETVQAQTAGS